MFQFPEASDKKWNLRMPGTKEKYAFTSAVTTDIERTGFLSSIGTVAHELAKSRDSQLAVSAASK